MKNHNTTNITLLAIILLVIEAILTIAIIALMAMIRIMVSTINDDKKCDSDNGKHSKRRKEIITCRNTEIIMKIQSHWMIMFRICLKGKLLSFAGEKSLLPSSQAQRKEQTRTQTRTVVGFWRKEGSSRCERLMS